MMIDFLNNVDTLLWNGCLVGLLIGIGLFLTIRLKGVQFRYFFYSLRLAFTRNDPDADGDISQFQSLMTALAATIGIGSIAGVATAIVAGGFGAIFWMWVIALLGMATKYAEAILAVTYRKVDSTGAMSGGPMYYIGLGLGWKKWATLFSVFCLLSAFAGGNLTQSNSIALAFQEWLGFSPRATGLVLMLLTGTVLLKGIQGIGKICAYFVPFMALFYVITGLWVIFSHVDQLLEAFVVIFKSAFTGQAACGGFLGSSVARAVQMGIARGVSSNEAGLGSAPIAAAAAKTDFPGRQALISMTGVFLSSFVVCTITALVIAVTGVLGSFGEEGELLNGAPLVMRAFSSVIPGGGALVAIGLVLFGYSTILGWAYYGEKCLGYLLSDRLGVFSIFVFRAIFCSMVFLGAITRVEVVWPLVDIMNGLMAFPNLIALFFLSPVVVRESERFYLEIKREKKEEKALLRKAF